MKAAEIQELAGMLLLFQLHFYALALHGTELCQLAELGLLGLFDAYGANTSVALGAEAGVDGTFPSWHSCGTLLGYYQKCKS